MNINPIGVAHSTRKEATDDHWLKEESYIELSSEYSPESLAGLTDFSHVEILFYMNQVDPQKIEPSARHPRNNTSWPKVGIFGQRGKNRPNQIGLTICNIIKVEGRKLFIEGLDAIDGTPVLDIKPWIKEFGPRGAVRQPEWSSELMKEYWQAPQNAENTSAVDPILINPDPAKELCEKVSSPKRQVIAIGGGGFSMEIDNPLLDLYVLKAANKPNPKICFIGTASGDAQGYIDKFYSAFRRYDCEPTHLSLFKGKFTGLREFILAQDIIYVGGGNTKNMLALWKEWGLDHILYEAYLNNVVMAGISAGAICWFEQMLTDSVPGKLTSLNGLGWLKGFCVPHFDGEADRMPSTIKSISTKILSEIGWGIDDGAAVHYINEKRIGVVSSHPEKSAYLFTEGASVPTICQPNYLGGHETFIRRAALADAEGIHNAHIQSILEVCSKDYSEVEIKAWGNRQLNREQRESSIKNDFVWVVEAAGTIQGYGHIKLFEKDSLKQGHLYGLYLTPQVLSKGFGQRIVALMIEQAKDFGAKKISLESTISAHSFYGLIGFCDNGVMTVVKINNQEVRCYPMFLDLTNRPNEFGLLHHVEIYVSDLKTSTLFWSWFLQSLGYFQYQCWELGTSYRKGDTYIVFVQTEAKYKDIPYHRCRTGLNHLAFHASSKEMVDQITLELKARKINILYEDQHPHAEGKSYGVYFEDPDRIKVELVAPLATP